MFSPIPPVIKWSDFDLNLVTAVLMKINPCQHRNVESMENYIKSIAHNYAKNCVNNSEVPSMTGTGGWYVTFIPSEEDDYDYTAEVTLMPYVVAKYLNLR